MERSLFELNPPTRWLARRVDLYRELDSTNRLAEALAARGAPHGTIVLADGQSAGRGRLGRSFFSPPGRSLYLSALLRPGIGAEHAHRYVFAAALAVADTLRAFLPASVPVEIKWPNDVLLGGRKASGINLPVQLDGPRVASLVLGIGVNVNLQAAELPAELVPIATSLRIASGRPADRVAVAERLLERLEGELDRLEREGFAAVLDAWRKSFRMQGERVRVGGPGVPHPIEGIAAGVDDEGALLVRVGDRVERVLAGDVSLLARGG
jgi:BirA family biotin operon repressor/biotin-[acetyl-CoA-carboxylase] ligase